MKGSNLKLIIYTVLILLFFLCLNTIAYLYSPFADFYTYHIFNHISNIFSRVFSLLPFSVGNLLIFIYLYVVSTILFILILIIIFIKNTRKLLGEFLIRFLCYNLIIYSFLFLFNIFIPYHTSNLSKIYFNTYEKKYTTDDLYNTGVKVLNGMEKTYIEVEKDIPNYYDYLEKESIAALKNISDKYTLLKGYYPNAKKVSKYFFDASGMYFPYTLEATYIPVIRISDSNTDYYLPTTITHEYAHLKGYAKEDEATFISIIAGINSDNDLFKYSAYLNAFDYITTTLYNLNDGRYIKLQEKWSKTFRKYNQINSYITYSDLIRNKYYCIDLDSWNVNEYDDYSTISNFYDQINDLVLNDSSMYIKYKYLDNDGKDINSTDGIYEYINAHLFIDSTKISEEKYNKLYDLILDNYNNDILNSMNLEYSEGNYTGNFNGYINQVLNSKKETKINKSNSYIMPDTERYFFFNPGNGYEKSVRLLLEYFDKDNK